MYFTKIINDILKTVTCTIHLTLKQCMYRECERCKETKIPRSDGKDIVKQVKTCNNSLDIKQCMYRECERCKETKIPRSDGKDIGKQVKWRMWKNVRIETEKRQY